MAPVPTPGRLALLVGGGPAPGLNGVISSVTIEAIEQGIEVIGFQDGFKWLVKGDADHYRKLAIDDVKGIYLRGGSVLGTSRTNPAKSDEHMRNVLETLRKLNVTHAGDHRRRRHGLFGQPGLPAGRRRHPRGPRPQDDRQRPAAARLGADVRLRDGPPPRRRHRAQPGRGRPHHVALVPDRQHGPGGRPPGAGHRQGGGRHAHHHPGGVPRPAGQHRRDVRHPDRLHRQAAQRQPAITASRCWPRG